MRQDEFTTMMQTGDYLVKIIRSVPKDKQFLLSMAVDAFLSGMTAGERLSAQAGADRDST